MKDKCQTIVVFNRKWSAARSKALIMLGAQREPGFRGRHHCACDTFQKTLMHLLMH